MKNAYDLIVILVVLFKMVLCQECCPSSNIAKPDCVDGSEMTLDCQHGKYSLSADEGELVVVNGTLYTIKAEGNHSIPTKWFCVGTDDKTKKKIAIVCFDDPTESADKIGYMKIYSICLLISDLFLVFTLIVYMAFPILRDLQGKCVMSFTFCLFLGYFILAIMQQEYFGHLILLDNFCKFMGFILYYLLMCAFFWLSIISFNIWKITKWQTTGNDAQLGLVYNFVGYGIPLIFLLVTFLAHLTPGNHIKPDFSSSCWFSGEAETWLYFYGPIGILLSSNIVFFTLTVIRLWNDYKDSSPGTRIQVLRFKCVLYLKLFLTMGIAWIFEIVSYMFETGKWYVTDIVNCLQGVIIFIVMVATRKRVLRLIANTGLFGSCFNKNWQTVTDEESENEVQPEQIQLS